jgi:hypothetical protein
VSERHRSDVSDILHLILCRGDELDWERLLRRVDVHWRLLLAQVHLFDYVYPGHRQRIPQWLRRHLYDLAEAEIDAVGDPEICQGTLISRFSYNIDVNEWDFRNPREEWVRARQETPIINSIAESDVWEVPEGKSDE